MVYGITRVDAVVVPGVISFFFFFNDTATTEIYTLSLHDALPIYVSAHRRGVRVRERNAEAFREVHEDLPVFHRDRKSTRLNSSHSQISYAVFCLKKKKHPSMLHRIIALVVSLACSSSIFVCIYTS